MAEINVQFNPWQETFKKPFGAVAVNQTVTFNLKVTAENPKVFLVIRKENSFQEECLMKATEDNFYAIDFQLAKEIGLYFYYFKIEVHQPERDIVAYVGKNHQNLAPKLTGNLEEVWEFQLTSFEAEIDQAPEWYRQAIAYQIFPDRFNEVRDTLPNRADSLYYLNKTDAPYYIKDEKGEVVRWDFYGGNFAGILAKLPYLKKLGVSLIYLNPIFEAGSNHRYDTGDYFKIDDFLGNNEDFKKFVEQLHQEGIRVILDGVFNHVGRNSRYFNGDGSYDSLGAYQSRQSPYYPWFNFGHFPEDYRSWWGFKNLPETNKQNPGFQDFIYGKDGVIDYWSNYGVDGWRIDVADEFPDFFLRGIRNRLNHHKDQILIGEVWEDASNKISYNQRRDYILGNSLHGVMNYPLKNAIVALVTDRQTPEGVAWELTSLRENYPRANFFNGLNHLSTHDTERIFSLLDQNIKALEQAVAFMFCVPGVPCIYYGDEAGLTGGKDPDNRKFYPWGRENEKVKNIYQDWSKRRKEKAVLAEGEVYFGYYQDFMIVLRADQTDYALLILNTSSSEAMLVFEEIDFLRPLPEKLAQAIKQMPPQKLSGKDCLYRDYRF
ncbi:glycoside hydrolase family 13 protein [Enterococcus sp. LJL90]